MRELLLSEIFPPKNGGSGRWLYEVYRRYEERTIIWTDSDSDQPNEPLSSLSEVLRSPFLLTDTGGLSFSGFKGYWHIAQRLKKISDAEIITRCRTARVVPEGWAAWIWKHFLGGPPYQVFAHGEEVNLDGSEDGGVMSSRQHRIMARLVFRSADLIIANSRNTAEILTSQWRLPKHKISIVHPGVDTKFFIPRSSIWAKKEIPEWKDRFVLLTVGRLQQRKGHDKVIRCIPHLRNYIPNLLYVIAGDGEEHDHLQQLAKQLMVQEHVVFYRNASDTDLRQMYQDCDVFILANRQIGSDVEGFGMVLLEAAACGKPTITGISGGTSEAIKNGITGILIDSQNESQVSKAILKLHSDPELRRQMGIEGRQRAVREFDWEVVANQIRNPKTVQNKNP